MGINLPASAKTRGFYLGAQAGYSFVNYTNQNLAAGFSATKIVNDGIATHIYLGYNINQYSGIETGIVYSYQPKFYNVTRYNEFDRIENNIVYLVGKGVWPVAKQVSLYAKAGVGYIVRTGLSLNSGTVILKGKEIVTAVYGLGVNYNFYKRWDADLSWLQAAPCKTYQLPTTNFVGLGINYRFYSF